MINVRQIAKFVVGLGEKVSPTDVEEGMRVGVDRTKYSVQIPLPPKIDPTVRETEAEIAAGGRGRAVNISRNV